MKNNLHYLSVIFIVIAMVLFFRAFINFQIPIDNNKLEYTILSEVILIKILFIIPVLILVIGLFLLKSNAEQNSFIYLYGFMISISISLYCLPWLSIIDEDKSFDFWVNICLGSVIFLLLFIGVITFITFEPWYNNETNISQWMHELRQDITQTPFWLLMMCFSIFLSITYLFGFSYYFHNQAIYEKSNHKMYALYMSMKYEPTQNFQADENNGYTSTLEPLKFYFNKTSAQFENDISASDNPISKEEKLVIVSSDKTKELGDPLTNEDIIKFFADKIVKLGKEGQRVRITLTGYTDKDPIKNDNSNYNSNYELACARINTIRAELYDALLPKKNGEKWINTEWLERPNTICNIKTKRNEKCRKVEVLAETIPGHITNYNNNKKTIGKELSLLDAIYFATYTITTTGYGDIIPITPYARFLSTLANIYEVIFIVIFLGALISIRQEIPKKNVKLYQKRID